MTLLDIRKQLVEVSGRYDMVQDTETYADSGANFYIQAGQRLLDSMFTHNKSYGQAPIELEVGRKLYPIPGILSIEGVQVSSDEGRVTLKQVQQQDIEERNLGDDEATGTPTMYAIYTSPLANMGDGTVQELRDVTVMLFPIPDTAVTMYVYGRISSSLKKDSDRSFWTINYPETLISAALYQVERFHRNRQGMQDYMESIQRDLRELDSNAIESQVGSTNQMNDSFKFRGKGNEW